MRAESTPLSGTTLRVVLICHHDAPLHRVGIARWIASWATLAGIVVIREPRRVLRRRLRREWKRVGTLRLLDVLAFRLYYRALIAPADRAWSEARLNQMQREFPDLPADTPVIDVQSPGSGESQSFMEAARPDIVIALCKTILPERVFSIPRFGTFVFHPGICPEYRNAHGCFWALASDDTSNVGMTLLRIDKGIDTGPVFGHFGVSYDELQESHARIQHRAVLDNLDVLRERLQQVASGRAHPVDVSGRPSAEWGQPWLTAWLRWKSHARERARARRVRDHHRP
jgi:hypothetical protein